MLLLSRDGLPIHHAGTGLGARDRRRAGRDGRPARRPAGRRRRPGRSPTAVLEYTGGLLVLARVGDGEWLALLARPGRDIGPLLYDLRQHDPRPSL